MSTTKACVIVKDGRNKKYFYRYYDGYPDGVGVDLMKFILYGGGNVESVKKFCEALNYWDSSYEIGNGIYGNEDYIYVIDLFNKKYLCYEVIPYIASESNLDKYNKIFEKDWSANERCSNSDPKSTNNLYKHIKTGKIYSLITDNFMFKDNGVWREGLILYKAEYDNPAGEYFAREAEDFYKKFEKL